MPAVQCSTIVAALLTTHATVHVGSPTRHGVTKMERIKRSTISSASTSKEWQYFTTRWAEYVQPLESLEEKESSNSENAAMMIHAKTSPGPQ